MTQVRQVALAARVFTLAALASVSVLLGRDATAVALEVIAIAAAAEAISLGRWLEEDRIAFAEAALVAVLAVVVSPRDTTAFPYLAIPPLVAGVAARVRGVVQVLCIEAIVLVGGFMLRPGHIDRATAASGLGWALTGLGLGLLGASMHRLLVESEAVSSYRSALGLIEQLHSISATLSDGLDVPTLAAAVVETANRRLPLRGGMLFARTAAGRSTPLYAAPGTRGVEIVAGNEQAERAWSAGVAHQSGRVIAVPLTRDGQPVAVLVAEAVELIDPAEVEGLDRVLSGETLKLDAALLFAEVRDVATREERQRLAREVHDGIAQDVASLGYLVDGIPASAPDLPERLAELRTEITRVVSELRHSVFDLRHEVDPGRGLGESLASLARHVGARSDLTIHLTLDEVETRLRADVEAELLRIAQEAMNNARKHAGARNLWLSCQVHPPLARIEVRDDGSGLGAPRSDSHGLKIMRERSERIGAQFDVSSPVADGHGTRVLVSLGREGAR